MLELHNEHRTRKRRVHQFYATSVTEFGVCSLASHVKTRRPEEKRLWIAQSGGTLRVFDWIPWAGAAFRPLSRGPRRAGTATLRASQLEATGHRGAFSSCCWAFMLPQRYRLAGDSPREAQREMLLTVTRSAGFHGRAPARRGFSTWKESRHLVTGLGRGRPRAPSPRHSGQTPRMNRPQLQSRCLVSAARAVPGPGGSSGPGGGATSIHPGPGGWGGGVILMTPPQM